MSKIILTNNNFLFRTVDFLILAMTFVLAYNYLKNAVVLETNIYLLASIYALTAFVLVRVSRVFVKDIVKSSSDILKMAFGNACGLLSSIIVFSILAIFSETFSELLPLAVISSVASFFILGTVVPTIKRILEKKADHDHQSFKAAI
ncbi:MAG: hypothetical protein ISR69_01690 [Gammaproteobacteria bacterium]|nr:hypothetical protein [Gammaproteobacteria bacterium]